MEVMDKTIPLPLYYRVKESLKKKIIMVRREKPLSHPISESIMRNLNGEGDAIFRPMILKL